MSEGLGDGVRVLAFESLVWSIRDVVVVVVGLSW